MAEDVKVETTPVIAGLETAPLIFANGVCSFSGRGGIASIILFAQRNRIMTDGSETPQFVVTADLRIPFADVGNLRDALDKIMLGAAKPQGQA